jgi:SAM-dependent methyltransferase
MSGEWYEHWFGEAYLGLYPHRDTAEAARAVALLQAHDMVRLGDRVLDLACGAGRHIAALASAGATVTGLDLSRPLLNAAREAGAAQLVRADMRRLPVRSGAMDAVVNLFTSFGYFARDDEHAMVLREIARVLVPTGRFALDFLNAPAVRAGLVARDERTVQGRRVVQERRISDAGRVVVKTIHLADEDRQFMERVRLFERPELETMMADAGLAVRHVFGDYDGSAHGPSSPRLILLAQRA